MLIMFRYLILITGSISLLVDY